MRTKVIFFSEKIFVFYCEAPEGTSSPGPRLHFGFHTPIYQVILSEHETVSLLALSLITAEFNSRPFSLLTCRKSNYISILTKAPEIKVAFEG